jgi:hypothetical protein
MGRFAEFWYSNGEALMTRKNQNRALQAVGPRQIEVAKSGFEVSLDLEAQMISAKARNGRATQIAQGGFSSEHSEANQKLNLQEATEWLIANGGPTSHPTIKKWAEQLQLDERDSQGRWVFTMQALQAIAEAYKNRRL